MPLQDVLGSLGDAIAGVDRDAAYRTGMQQRATFDNTEAQAEAAMALAMQRRQQAEMEEQIKQWRQRVAATSNAAMLDPMQAPLGVMTAGDMGTQYAGTTAGAENAQAYQLRETVATPEGETLDGLIMDDARRQAGLDALAPSAAVATRRPRAGAPVIVQDDDGQPIFVEPQDAPGRRPAARPSSAAGAGPTVQQRNFQWLTQTLGVDEETALRIATNSEVDAAAVYQRARDAVLRTFGSDEQAHEAGIAAVAAIGDLAQDVIPNPAQPGAEPVETELGGAAGTVDDPFEVMDDVGYDALPPGAFFIDPQGNLRQKP